MPRPRHPIGIWYMSRDYIALTTTYIFLNRHAISGEFSLKE